MQAGPGLLGVESDGVSSLALLRVAFSSRSNRAWAPRGRRAGETAEHSARDESGAARVVEVEDPADHLAGGVEPRYLGRIVIEHLSVGVDAKTAEREGDPARGRVRLERRLVDRVGPVRLRGLEADGATAVPRVRIEGHVAAHGRVEGAHGTEKALGIHIFELRGQLFERLRPHLGHARDAVLGAQQMKHLRIEDLPGELPGLLEDRAAVLRVGEAVEVGALVDEAPAVGVDEDAEGIAVLLELVADGELAELGRVPVPAAGVAARPVAEGVGADLQGHAEAVAGVEARAAHLGQLPARTEVARPPLGVGLEAAAGEHDRPRDEITNLSTAAYAHAVYTHTVPQERQRPRLVEDLDPTPVGRRRQ